MKNFDINLSFLERVTLKDKVFLARQLATMLSAGIPIDQCFKIINYQEKKQVLKNIYQSILHDLEEGNSLSFAVSKYRKVFDPVFIAVIRSGETTGQLDKVLLQLADRMEVTQEFQTKIRSALMYPTFVLISMLVIVYLMMVYIVPPLKSVFEESGAELPTATWIIVSLSDFSVQYWWVELIGLAALVSGGIFFFRSKQGGSFWDKMKINIPFFRNLYVMVYMARFCRTMSILTRAGIPIIETLAVTADVIQNQYYTESLRKVAAQVERGVPVSVPLEKDALFPVLVSQMIIVGEQTGKMEIVLDKLAEFYERETDSWIKGFGSLIEPVMIIVIGAGVGFLVYSIIFPIYSLSSINW